MYRFVLAVAILTATQHAAAAICNVGDAHPKNPPETEQFAFLLGTHDVTLHAWQAQTRSWTPPRPVGAVWNGYWGLDGATIVDEWFDPAPSDDALSGRGINVRIFEPEVSEWKMMWVARPGYQVQDLRARLEPEGLTMWQVYPERPHWKAVFEILDDDRWARTSYSRTSADAAWEPQFRLVATRSCTLP